MVGLVLPLVSTVCHDAVPRGIPMTPEIVTVASGSGLPPGLLRAALGDAPAILTSVIGDTAALETNLARAPVFEARPVQLALLEDHLPVNGRRFVFRADRGALTPRDQGMIAGLIQRFVENGFPEDGAVRFSLGEGARWLGYAADIGGTQRQAVKDSLRRIKGVELESTILHAEGEDWLAWDLLRRAWTSDRAGGKGAAWLSEELAALVAAGSVTLLDMPTFTKLVNADEVACRLWTFLEADDGPERVGGWRYSLFAAPPATIAVERHMPALVDLLRIHNKRRRDAARRVEQAADVVQANDPHYRLSMARTGHGMWTLHAKRVGRTRRATRANETRDQGEPDALLGRMRRATVLKIGGTVGLTVGSTVGSNRPPSTKAECLAFLRDHRAHLSEKIEAMLEVISWKRDGYRWIGERLAEAPEGSDLIGYVKAKADEPPPPRKPRTLDDVLAADDAARTPAEAAA